MAEERAKRRIILHVYNQELPITIYSDEEQLYRDAAKLVTEKVNYYATIAKRSNINDHMMLYMVLVDIAMMYQREHEKKDTIAISDVIGKLTSEIESTLKNDSK